MKYAYFPGCSLHSSAEEYNRSAKAVAAALGIELREIPDWLCCGATPAHITNRLLSLALPLSNCVWAEQEGLDLVACCAACFHRLKMANIEVGEDAALLSTVNEVIGENYQGKVKVLHLLEVLSHEIGLETIRKRVKRPLKGLKVASYYGCLLTRLPRGVRIDSAENPMIMDELITALGADAIDWPYKTECCGASLAVIQKKTVIRLAHDILRIAKDKGAECIAVACPLCQSNLDLCQKGVERKYRTKLNMPVFYFTQLAGLALGLEKEKLGLEKLIVDPMKLLEGKGLIKSTVDGR